MSKLFSLIKFYCRIFIKAFCCVFERIKNIDAAYLVLTPEHGNLGDHAIAQAEQLVLKQAGIKAIEVTTEELKLRRELGLLRLMNGRLILVNGGGNLGTLWFSVEELIRAVIEKNPKSNIFIFPSTIYYDDTDFGNKEKKKSKEIYNAHNKLVLYLRESESYRISSELYKNITVKLMPDMAMLLNYCEPHVSRHGCILTLRSDREKTRSDEQDAAIIDQVSELFGSDYSYLDMNVGHRIPVSQRDEALSTQFYAFRHAELVITDRLHGMIFSAITGTPCIVIESKSHKVRGCYEWIKDLEYIRFAEDASSIVEEYHRIPKGEHHYDNSRLIHYYEELAEEIRNDLLRGKKKCR